MINVTDEQWEMYFDALAAEDYTVIDHFFSEKYLKLLLQHFELRESQDSFEKAAIGSSGNELVINEIRGDFTYWIDRQRDSEIVWLFDALHDMRQRINQACYLSLSDFEFHFAHYPKGSFYKKHLDQFAERSNRMISVVVYLNQNWQHGHGGELRIFPEGQESKDIAPLLNRCILFRSDKLFHEVLMANESRRSLTGWMLYQPSVIASIL